MKRRAGKTTTFSISVDSETQRLLKSEAKRIYGGNVSALVSAIAKEAKRQASLEWLIQGSGKSPMTEAEKKKLLSEIGGREKAPSRRRRTG